MGNINKLVINIREILWPLLEPLKKSSPKKISESDCMWNNNDTDMILKYIEKYSESEEKRKKEVESKSTIFIGTFGVATAVLINLIKDMVLNNTVAYTPFRLFLICMMTLSIIYLCRAIWFSIKALERRNYYTMGFPDFMLTECDDKKKKIIIMQYNNVKKNQHEINVKVDYMTMAQEYFKRAIIVVALFSFIVLMNYVLSYKKIMKDILNIIESLSINQFILIGIFCSLLILFFIVIILFSKVKRLEESDSNE